MEAGTQDQPGQTELASAAASGLTTPVRILVVEDNLVNQKVVSAILKKRPYQIEIANNGKEALEKLERATGGRRFSLVLMDIQMPVLDGLEATRAIRRNDEWNYLPIVAMTAHAMNGDRERCLQAGMNGYISKPVQPSHLLSMIESHLKAPPAAAQLARQSDLDESLAARLMSHEAGLVSDMLQLFLQLAPERLNKLQAAVQGADVPSLVQEARKISKAAANMAATTVSGCAQELEHAAERGDFAAARERLIDLEREVVALQKQQTEHAA